MNLSKLFETVTGVRFFDSQNMYYYRFYCQYYVVQTSSVCLAFVLRCFPGYELRLMECIDKNSFCSSSSCINMILCSIVLASQSHLSYGWNGWLSGRCILARNHWRASCDQPPTMATLIVQLSTDCSPSKPARPGRAASGGSRLRWVLGRRKRATRPTCPGRVPVNRPLDKRTSMWRPNVLTLLSDPRRWTVWLLEKRWTRHVLKYARNW